MAVADDEKVDASVPIVLFCSIGDVNDEIFRYMAIERQVPMAPFYNSNATRPGDFIERFVDAHFIVVAQTGTKIMADFMPGAKFQDDLLAEIQSRPEFMQIGRWSFMKSPDRGIFLFMRHDPSTDVPASGILTPISGMGPVEGPFPAQHMRLVRWGMGPLTRLNAHADRSGKYLLQWIGRTDFQEQIVTVTVDGKEATKQPIPGSFTEFHETRVYLNLGKGDHVIELRYARWHQEARDPRPMGVLYKLLRLSRISTTGD